MRKIFLIIMVLPVALLLFSQTAVAQNFWVAPTSDPPGGTTYPPVDTSSNNQTKAGGLTLQGVLEVANIQGPVKILPYTNPAFPATLEVETTGTGAQYIAVKGIAQSSAWAGYFWGPLGTNSSFYATSTAIGEAAWPPTAALQVVEMLKLEEVQGNYQIIESLGGLAGSNYIKKNLWLYRDADGQSWTTARLFEGVSVDTSWTAPHTTNGPRVWFERDPQAHEFKWGSSDGTGDKTFMTLVSGGLLLNTDSSSHKLEVNMGNGSSNYFAVGNDNNIGLILRSGTTLGTPYIDFYNDAGASYDARIILDNDDLLRVSGAGLKVENGSLTLNQPTIDVKNENLYLNSDGEVLIRLDADNDTSNVFKINDGANNTVFSVYESGVGVIKTGLVLTKITTAAPTCDAASEGEMIYLVAARRASLTMCMQTGAGTYAWNEIDFNSW